MAASATTALDVSTDTTTSAPARIPSITGSTRSSSSSSEMPSEPGRVDSPPTSTMTAPSATCRRPSSIASAGSRNRPPSENESGVTLTTPISAGATYRSRSGGVGATPDIVEITGP